MKHGKRFAAIIISRTKQVLPLAAKGNTMSEIEKLVPVGQPRLVRLFEVGQKVRYLNHVAGYEIATLTVEIVGDYHVVANTEGWSRPMAFRKADGVATWSENLSIIPLPNSQAHPPKAG